MPKRVGQSAALGTFDTMLGALLEVIADPLNAIAKRALGNVERGCQTAPVGDLFLTLRSVILSARFRLVSERLPRHASKHGTNGESSIVPTVTIRRALAEFEW